MRDEELDKLFAAVRSKKPDTANFEEHFETRLMARIEEQQQSSQALWQVWIWRLIPFFALFVICVGIGSLLYDPTRSGDLFAPFSSGYEEYMTTSLLVGG